jgi:molybdate transport system substrate-binding protein
MQRIRLLAALAGWAIAVAAGLSAQAADIKVTASNALKTTLEQLAPDFEKATGHKLVFTFGAGAVLRGTIEKGAPLDAVVLQVATVDDLVAAGKLRGEGRTVLAYSNAGLAVRKGAPKPDISTVEAFKRALIAAKSIGIVEQGGTGIYLKTLLPRLGIAEALAGKIKYLPPENPAANAVANGEAEMGMTQISEILPYAGAELVGPLPKEIQLTDTFAIAIGAGAAQPQAATALIAFLTSPAAAPVYRAKGLDPAARE